MITPAGVVSTLAGAAGSPGSADGIAGAARFAEPQGIATDRLGNIYVADTYNHTFRKIDPAGRVSTLAGVAGSLGSADGIGTEAHFDAPWGVAPDSSGNIYVADSGNHRIRKITPAGAVSTLAGAGSFGSADGVGAQASFDGPSGVAADSAGNLYVADAYNDTIRKIFFSAIVFPLYLPRH